jgi:hypothetical protein
VNGGGNCTPGYCTRFKCVITRFMSCTTTPLLLAAKRLRYIARDPGTRFFFRGHPSSRNLPGTLQSMRVTKRRKGETKEAGGKEARKREAHAGNRADPATQADAEHSGGGKCRSVNYNLHQIKVIITVDEAFLITR